MKKIPIPLLLVGALLVILFVLPNGFAGWSDSIKNAVNSAGSAVSGLFSAITTGASWILAVILAVAAMVILVFFGAEIGLVWATGALVLGVVGYASTGSAPAQQYDAGDDTEGFSYGLGN